MAASIGEVMGDIASAYEHHKEHHGNATFVACMAAECLRHDDQTRYAIAWLMDRGMPAIDLRPRPTLDAVFAKVRDVERLNLGPGDALAFIVSKDTTHEQASGIKRYLAEALPGVRCVIVAGATLQVISQQVADEIERTARLVHTRSNRSYADPNGTPVIAERRDT